MRASSPAAIPDRAQSFSFVTHQKEQLEQPTERASPGSQWPLAVQHDLLDEAVHAGVVEDPSVVFVIDGWARFRYESGEISAQPGRILALPQGLTFSTIPRGFLRTITVRFNPNFTAMHFPWLPQIHPLVNALRSAQHDAMPTAIDVSKRNMTELHTKLSTLAELSASPSREFAVLARVADLFDTMSHLEPGTPVSQAIARDCSGSPRRLVASATQALHARLDHRWTMSELARQMSISESQLRRLFLRDLGISPANYLRRARAVRMAEILIGTDITVTEAALQVGWPSVSVAGRIFRRHFGTSPRRFQAMSRMRL